MKNEKYPNLEIDFIYLAYLTRAGLKPLSRWEKTLAGEEIKFLEDLKLKTAFVRRQLLDTSCTTELIFANTDTPIDIYLNKFDDTSINKSVETQFIEGYLFGYPPCCVESFAKYGYINNSLNKTDQQLLFHWACPKCKITPLLLTNYRCIQEECLKFVSGEKLLVPEISTIPTARKYLKRSIAVAASLAMVVAGIGTHIAAAQNSTPTFDDLHLLPLPPDDDNDADGLIDAHEAFLGLDSTIADTDTNGVIDGVQIATAFAAEINQLDSLVKIDKPYIEEFQTYGVETCDICGETKNMGFIRIHNPEENLYIDVPFMALHFLEHGSFKYSGSTNQGVVDARLLHMILNTKMGDHWLQVQNDLDADGLKDSDEAYFNTDENSRDSDANGIPDGPQIAQELWMAIESLPTDTSEVSSYRVDLETYGLETCEVCGEIVNMGYIRVINPLENIVVELPYIAHHFLKHGSFLYDGDVHGANEVNTRGLDCSIHSDGTKHHLPVQNDPDGDGLSTSEENTLNMNSQDPDENSDNVLDGVWLASYFKTIIDNLPSDPDPTEIYAEPNLMWGVETCEICGEQVNMGFWKIVNPLNQDTLDIYEIGLHYMEHGSFNYHGDLHNGRIDIVTLARILQYIPSAVTKDDPLVPNKFVLLPNYPNPFNTNTVFVFNVADKNLDVNQQASLKIYNILGQPVRSWKIDANLPGLQHIGWNGCSDAGFALPGGIYFAKLQSGDRTHIRKITLMK